MDMGLFGNSTFDWAFFSTLFSIVIIDLILAGDNAVVIAMAVRSLPNAQHGVQRHPAPAPSCGAERHADPSSPCTSPG